MDQEAYNQWSKHFDEKFEKEYPQFTAWFRTHLDYQEGIRPRIAYKCECYRQQYLAAREVGVA